MNIVGLVGRLTKNPDVRMNQSGKSVCRFTVAVDRLSQNGSQADFISCTAFGKIAENMGRYLGKGSKVGVSGSIKTGSYENQNGQKIYTTDVWADRVDFLDSKPQNGSTAPQNAYQPRQDAYQGGYQNQYQPQNQYQQAAYQPQNNYQPQNQYQQAAYQPQAVSTNQANAFESSDVLSIDSDDLPF